MPVPKTFGPPGTFSFDLPPTIDAAIAYRDLALALLRELQDVADLDRQVDRDLLKHAGDVLGVK